MTYGWCKLFVLALAATTALLTYLKGHQASLSALHKKGKEDCFFDKECHDKVNWDSVAKLKWGFQQRTGALLARSHQAFRKAGVPEDRIDYILLKWVKALDPSHQAEVGIDTKDCYFDVACHDKADWERVTVVKFRFFKGLKFMLQRMRIALAKTGMPKDRIDYSLFKWAENANASKGLIEKAFGKGRPAQEKPRRPAGKPPRAGKVAWRRVTEIKRGFFVRLELLKAQGKAGDVEGLVAQVRRPLLETGVPEPRVTYMLATWVKSAYPEAFEKMSGLQAEFKALAGKKAASRPKLDLEMLKKGFLARLDVLKAKGRSQDVKGLMAHARTVFPKVGIPEDRADDLLASWVKLAYPEASEEDVVAQVHEDKDDDQEDEEDEEDSEDDEEEAEEEAQQEQEEEEEEEDEEEHEEEVGELVEEDGTPDPSSERDEGAAEVALVAGVTAFGIGMVLVWRHCVTVERADGTVFF